jgi:membrane protein DedA with SNARE-associated domain
MEEPIVDPPTSVRGSSTPGGVHAPFAPSGPPSHLVRNLVIGTLIAFVIASNVGNLFLSVLVSQHPAVFIALNPSNRNLALASGDLGWVSFGVIGFLRLIGPDPLFFLLGRWYGDGAIRWMERRAPTYGDLARQLERWFAKARIPVVAFAPNNYVCLFAGASGMGWAPFLAANAVGTIGRLVLIRIFSSLFEGPLGSLRGFIGEYRWPLLAVSFLVVGWSLWSEHRRGANRIGDLAHIEAEIDEDEASGEAAPQA